MSRSGTSPEQDCEPMQTENLGYGRYADDSNHVGCPRAKSDMTPCVARDGVTASTHAQCVGCGADVAGLLVELVRYVTEPNDE